MLILNYYYILFFFWIGLIQAQNVCENQNSDQNINIYYYLAIMRRNLPKGLRFRQINLKDLTLSGIFRENNWRRPNSRSSLLKEYHFLKKKAYHLREVILPLPRDINDSEKQKKISANADRLEKINNYHIFFFKCSLRFCPKILHKYLAQVFEQSREASLTDCGRSKCNINLNLREACDKNRPNEKSYDCFVRQCIKSFYESELELPSFKRLQLCTQNNSLCFRATDFWKMAKLNLISNSNDASLPNNLAPEKKNNSNKNNNNVGAGKKPAIPKKDEKAKEASKKDRNTKKKDKPDVKKNKQKD